MFMKIDMNTKYSKLASVIQNKYVGKKLKNVKVWRYFFEENLDTSEIIIDLLFEKKLEIRLTSENDGESLKVITEKKNISGVFDWKDFLFSRDESLQFLLSQRLMNFEFIKNEFKKNNGVKLSFEDFELIFEVHFDEGHGLIIKNDHEIINLNEYAFF